MQKGFATLEVILMVVVIGILASIAVPRFTAVTAAANTAKIQSDLSTIDTAIAIYQMEKGGDPSISDLTPYFQGNTVPKPPTGKYFMSGKIQDVALTTSAEYDVGTVEGDKRAVIKGTENTAEKFFVQDKGSTATGGTGGDNSSNENPGG